MPELTVGKKLYFDSVKQVVEHFHIKRLFKKSEGVKVEEIESYFEDILLTKKMLEFKFTDNFFTVNYLPEIQKIEVIIFK